MESNVVSVHPHAARRYKAKVEQIQWALTKGDAAGQEAVQLVRSLIDKIVITPGPDRMALEVFGDLAVLLGNKLSTDVDFGNAKDGCGGSIYSSTYVRRTPKGRVNTSLVSGCLSHYATAL